MPAPAITLRTSISMRCNPLCVNGVASLSFGTRASTCASFVVIGSVRFAFTAHAQPLRTCSGIVLCYTPLLLDRICSSAPSDCRANRQLRHQLRVGSSVRRSIRHAARRAGVADTTITKTGRPARSEGTEANLQTTRGLDISFAVSYVVSLCLCLMLRGLLRKPRVLRTVLVTGIMLAAAAPVHAQAKQAALSFDVVSVKPSDSAKEHLAL